ncbi:cation:proton antiporter [Azonexus caeni]|uniref:cation:proton antiporter domain-containing protein n=1 Tax=Azonexus caeni TaxID=266126 RepID=UPI003A8B472A
MNVHVSILFASAILLVAFAIERAGRHYRIPPVILLIAAGMLTKPLLHVAGWTLAGLDMVVPIIGTIGLVLIVLEGSLDISLSRERLYSARAAMWMAWLGFLACFVVLTPLIELYFAFGYFKAAVIAVPFALISSAVAIPNSQFLPAHGREFVVYESALSDIIGVIVFFALVHSDGSFLGIVQGLLGGGLVSLVLSVICAIGLALILMHSRGPIRFLPLLAGLLGLYAAGKLLYLSPLIMVLLFGLTINNPLLITRVPLFEHWMSDHYDTTLNEFKAIAFELTFAVRGFFFILLGYWTDLGTLAMPKAWFGALVVLFIIYLSRAALLRSFGGSLAPSLLWLAPRGLITVLLYLTARMVVPVPEWVGGSVLIVVIVSALLILVAQRRHEMPPFKAPLPAAPGAPAEDSR